MSHATAPLSIVIPTYRRGQVLLDTITWLRDLQVPAAEILVVDQTESHAPEIQQALTDHHREGTIRWLRLSTPSITHAMNSGLAASTQPLVLFLDDDIRPEPGLVAAHVAGHSEHADAIIAGRVIQPWEEGVDFSQHTEFAFAGLRPAWIGEFMGGNFSLRRETAISLGGFDENFVRVAYRFEAEFAERWKASGRRIRFEPGPCIHHLKGEGGTRSFGDYLTTWKPNHTIGAHYYLLRTRGWAGVPAMLARPVRAIATKHHLRNPWWIPFTLVSELLGMAWACKLALRGPKLITDTA